jgi:long-chain acyl-CoA synthetase
LKEWCAKHNIAYTTNEEMVKNKEVIDRLMKEVEVTNNELAHYEKIKKIALLPKDWSVEHGEMTPKLSLKRKVIMAANKEAYATIYNDTNGLR